MGRVRKLTIEGYRSIDNPIEVNFPEGVPVVLIGENNAGKSNIVRALEFILGERWPGNHNPDDHEFYGRRREGNLIRVDVEVQGVCDDRWHASSNVDRICWRYAEPDPCTFTCTLYDSSNARPVNNRIRNQCLCVTVGADRRFSQYVSYTSQYTILSKIAKRFHEALTSEPARVSLLKDQFASVVDMFHEVDEFATFKRELQDQVQSLGGNFAYRLDIDFSAYDPSNFFHSIRIQPIEGERALTLEELGTGQEQLFAISLVYAYAKAFRKADGLLLVIEEPEAHLHPLAQRWLATRIRELAAAGIQIVITTHSPSMVDILGLDGIVRVFRDEAATCVIQRTAKDLANHWARTGSKKYDSSTILPFYQAAASETILAGLFARKVVLVEGSSDALALPSYLSQVGLHVEREGIAVIPVNGVQNLAKWWRLFSAYQVPCYVIADSDPSKNQTTRGQKEVLSAMGVPELEIQQALTSQPWVIAERYSIFPGDLEAVLKRLFGERYDELDREADEGFGLGGKDAKPLRARHIASHIELAAYPEAHELFCSLARCIASVLPESSAESTIVNGQDDAGVPEWAIDEIPF